MQKLWSISIQWLEDRMLPCPFKFVTGCDCPACGTQRSILSLLKGDILTSWQHNPLGIGICVLGIAYLFGQWRGHQLGSAYARPTAYLLLLIVLFKWCWGMVFCDVCS